MPARNCFSQWVPKTPSSIVKSDDLGLDTSANPGPFPGVASDAPSDAMDVVSRREDGSVLPGVALVPLKPWRRRKRRTLRHHGLVGSASLSIKPKKNFPVRHWLDGEIEGNVNLMYAPLRRDRHCCFRNTTPLVSQTTTHR